MSAPFGNLIDEILDGPLVGGMLDDDFYTFTMGRVIHTEFPDVEVRYGLTNRTADVRLADEIDVDDLGDELDKLQAQRFQRSELHYIKGTDEYGERMFSASYVDHLRDLQRPGYHLSVVDGQFDLTFGGNWGRGMHWEVPALSLINGMRSRNALRAMSRMDREATMAQGVSRLHEKIAFLRKYHPYLMFCDFGTRRRFHRAWQRYIDQRMAEELPEQFLGTSNVEAAMNFSLLPMGTNAHQLVMVMAALCMAAEDPDAALAGVQRQLLDLWWNSFGEGLSIALTDTFGTDAFLRDFTQEMARNWKGTRQDSGDPKDYCFKMIAFYKALGIDPRSKMVIFSDGLDLKLMCELASKFLNQVKTSFGWGTNLTNDLGLPTCSVVIKPWFAKTGTDGIWYPTGKLTDNIAKAIGDPEFIERLKRVFDYDVDYFHAQRV
ncbi:MAG: nicotinate phosphoribosyltransferase [Parcubacteria group bacterium]|nr:nicotinate phosphoribosyltransferase [Parcubacteria group bacterium]